MRFRVQLPINTFKDSKKNGLDGLEERNRAHRAHPAQISSIIEERIVVHRNKHPRWGGEKIWKLLHQNFSEVDVPSVSTVNRVLKRNGLILPKKRLRRVKPVNPIFDPKTCNEVWSADFKGKFLLGNLDIVIRLQLQILIAGMFFRQRVCMGNNSSPL